MKAKSNVPEHTEREGKRLSNIKFHIQTMAKEIDEVAAGFYQFSGDVKRETLAMIT